MHIETALNAIKDWYEGEGFQIGEITDAAKGSTEDFDQSEVFLSVRGEQRPVGIEGDSFQGEIYFEYENGKYIKTYFWC